MDVPDFDRILRKLAKLFNDKQLDPDVIEVYYRALEGYKLRSIARAAKILSGTSKFFPLPVDFLAAIRQLPEEPGPLALPSPPPTEDDIRWAWGCNKALRRMIQVLVDGGKYLDGTFKKQYDRALFREFIVEETGFSREEVDRRQQTNNDAYAKGAGGNE